MIENKEKLNGCNSRVLAVVDFAEKIKGHVIVTSGKRSADENKNAGGAPKSAHLFGLAVDIVIPGLHPYKYISDIAHQFPDIKGIGVNPYAGYLEVHIDFSNERPVFAGWAYDRNNKYV